MKNRNKLIKKSGIIVLFSLTACSKAFLDQQPIGTYKESDLLNKKGITGVLVNAYAGLDGNAQIDFNGESGGPNNWMYGAIMGGDAYKGGVIYSDEVELNPIMQYASQSTNPFVLRKWKCLYDGIGRANLVLQTLAKVTDPSISSDDRIQIRAEARFIRGFQHFEVKKVFNNGPYVDEKAIDADYKVSNTDASGNYINIWPMIEADLKAAYDSLSVMKSDAGRANKWVAAAYLAKAYLYQKKYSEAKELFDLVITNGVNPLGQKFDLFNKYQDNFRVATKNGTESVFAMQSTLGDGGTANSNHQFLLTYPNGIAGGTNSWYFRPSQNMVNAFRTDTQGLPLFETYNDVDVTPFENISDGDPFTPYAGTLDSRLDWSVGRRGIPYLDWGMMTGVAFTAPPGESIDNAGAYCGKKHVFSKAELDAGLAAKVSWYYGSALNFVVMRFSDVLLMAAECEIELGNLEAARTYINRIRARAAASPVKGLNGSADAANYHVGLYSAPYAGKAEATKALRFERRLELGMEGHRFFDLVRWGNVAEEINNTYLPKERVRRRLIFNGVSFKAGRSEYQPIPEYVITQSNKDGAATLKQNPGY